MRKTINGKVKYIKCKSIINPTTDQLEEFVKETLDTTQELYQICTSLYEDQNVINREYFVYYYKV